MSRGTFGDSNGNPGSCPARVWHTLCHTGEPQGIICAPPNSHPEHYLLSGLALLLIRVPRLTTKSSELRLSWRERLWPSNCRMRLPQEMTTSKPGLRRNTQKSGELALSTHKCCFNHKVLLCFSDNLINDTF